jgi:hypothetical protein
VTPPPSKPALSRLCSADPEVFATQIWARRPWLSRARDLPAATTTVFSTAAVDELLSTRGLRTPFLRLAKDGRVVPAGQFTGSGGAGARIGDQVRDDAVLRLFADGTTVVLQGLHRTWLPVSEMAAGLAQDLGHPVQVNAYVTPAQSQGFAPHYDTHDVFVLQVAGRKAWRVHEPVIDAPLADQPWESRADAVRARAGQAPILETVLEPGDCLYLPRGFIHSAEALGGISIHLTFGIHSVVQRDVLRAILTTMQAERWQHSLPAGWDPTSDAGRTEIAGLAAELVEALTHVDVSEVAAAMHDIRAGLQRPEPVGPLSQMAAAADVSATDAVRLRAHLGARLDDDGQALIVSGERRVPVPDVADTALVALLSGRPVAVAGLTPETTTSVGIARRLIVEGVLVLDATRTLTD